MRIQHNIMAMNAYRNYTNNVSAMKSNLEKLSSGYKINRAGDDAAGLAISEKMRAQITGLQTAQKNAKDGISLVQTAEGALTEVHDMLNRMVELATQSANGTYDVTTDRAQMQKEMDELRSEINRIADSSNFNGINLLDGSMSTAMSKVGTVTLVNPGVAPTSNWVAATGVVTWAANATAAATFSQIPTTSLTHLHSDGVEGSVGEFTIDLGGLTVTGASGSNATITLTLNNGSVSASYTYTASATGTKVTASMVAADLATKKFIVTATGAMKIAGSTVAVGKNDVIYDATATGNAVTFKAANVVTTATNVAGAVGSKVTAIASNSENVPKVFSTGAKHNFAVTVAASHAEAGSEVGFAQVGVTDYKDLKADSGKQFAQAVLDFDATRIKDGMRITVNEQTFTFSFKAPAAGATGVIDLSKIVTAGATSITSSQQAAVAQAIAEAFKQVDNGGIEVGVNSDNDLVISEKVNSNRTSAAATATQQKLSDYNEFKKLVSFQTNNQDGGQDASARLTINAGKLYHGNKITVTDKDGNATTYTISTDKNDIGKNGYVYAGDDTAKALAAAIGNGATADGKNVIIDFNVTGGTELKDIKAKAEMSGNKGLQLQIGDTADSFNQLKVTINDCHTDSLGISDISIATQEDAAKAIDAIKSAINYVSDVRGTLGATQNRLDHTINNLSVMTENIQDAESTIRDTDVAEEMMAYTKNNILIQSAQAMLAQANQVPQGVLQLLQ